MQNKKLEIKDVVFENKDGSSYCKYKIKDVTFIISHVSNDKYSIEFEKDGLRPKSNITGKIFNNGAKTMRNHLINSIEDNLKIVNFESVIIVNELWENLDIGELGEFVFSTSINKMVEGTQFFKKSDNLSINSDDITLKILEDNHFITFIDTKEILKYENGVFIRYGKERIEEVIRELLGNYATILRINEITKNIQSRTFVHRDELDKDLNKINLKNGMFNIKENKLFEHSPKDKSIAQLPIIYDKDAKCPIIEKFMSEIVTPEEVKVLYEVIGYAMIPKINIKNSTLMLTGSGNNGKSVYLNIAKAFIGHKNTSLESLQRLEENTYSSSNLYGKLLNVFADLSADKLYGNGMFKTLTGEDGPIQAERKFENSFNFVNTARMMFSANKLPPVPDDDMTAFFDRLIVIPFTKKFTGKNADKNLNKKVITDKELSGLFNIVIESLRDVLENDKFSYDKSINEIEKIYRMHSDDIMIFANEKIIEDDNGKSIPKALMYKIYEKWCVENDIVLKSKNKFTRRLTSLGFFIGKKGSSNNQVLSWVNCKFKSAEDNVGQQQEIQVNKPLIQVPLVKIE